MSRENIEAFKRALEAATVETSMHCLRSSATAALTA
jgi:hypothetical protein